MEIKIKKSVPIHNNKDLPSFNSRFILKLEKKPKNNIKINKIKIIYSLLVVFIHCGMEKTTKNNEEK